MSDREIDARIDRQMRTLAHAVDHMFNGENKGDKREWGFTILVFPFGEAANGRANYISNGADRKDIAALFREMAARFEGQAETQSGRA